MQVHRQKTGSDDLRKDALTGVCEAIQHARNLWVLFLTFCSTAAILASGTTDTDLFLETPLRLPLFDVGVPLKLFYTITPFILVTLHLDLLIRLYDLRVRVGALSSIRNLRRYLPVLDYVFLAANLLELWSERAILKAISNVTIFIFPVAVLLFVEKQFLPFHSNAITWWHRVLLLADLTAIMVVHSGFSLRQFYGRNLMAMVTPFLNLAVALLAVFVIVFPGEPQDFVWPRAVANADRAEAIGLHRSLDLEFRHLAAREPPPEIVAAYLAGKSDIASDSEGVNAEDARSIAERLYGQPIAAIGRDLSYGTFRGSVLIGANFSHANLEASDFSEAQMTDADFTGATLDQAKFEYTNLRLTHFIGTSGNLADFKHADLEGAEFKGALFIATDMTNARINLGKITASNFDASSFSGSKLIDTSIETSSFLGATFLGADFSDYGPNFSASDLRGANLGTAKVRENGIGTNYTSFLWIEGFQPEFGEGDQKNVKERQEAKKRESDALERARLIAAFRQAHIVKGRWADNFATDVPIVLPPCCMPRLVGPSKYILVGSGTSGWLISEYPAGRAASTEPYRSQLLDFLTGLACDGHPEATRIYESYYPEALYPTKANSAELIAYGLARYRSYGFRSTYSYNNEVTTVDEYAFEIARAFLSNACVTTNLSANSRTQLREVISRNAASQKHENALKMLPPGPGPDTFK